jgi:hypothetical protein
MECRYTVTVTIVPGDKFDPLCIRDTIAEAMDRMVEEGRLTLDDDEETEVKTILVVYNPVKISVPEYNHAFTIAFAVGGSTDSTGKDVTAAMLKQALLKRIEDLDNEDSWVEAVGASYDTYEEGVPDSVLMPPKVSNEKTAILRDFSEFKLLTKEEWFVLGQIINTHPESFVLVTNDLELSFYGHHHTKVCLRAYLAKIQRGGSNTYEGEAKTLLSKLESW